MHRPSRRVSSAARNRSAGAPVRSHGGVAGIGQRRHAAQRVQQQPAEPDALALRRASPTRFMPSFQSPVPISGRPKVPSEGDGTVQSQGGMRKSVTRAGSISGWKNTSC